MQETSFVKLLIDTALYGGHSKFRFIRNFAEFEQVIAIYLKTRKIARGFKQEAAIRFKLYAKKDQSYQERFQNLVAVKISRHCAQFYKTEVKCLKQRIVEYMAYLADYHLRYSLTGGQRLSEDLYDYSKWGLTEDYDHFSGI